MAKYAMSVNGTSYEIEIEDPRAEPVKVIVNGRAFVVSVARHPSGTAPRTAPSDRPAQALEELYVPTVASTYVETSSLLEEEPSPAPTPDRATDKATARITAPMPGKILDIAVQVGSQVEQGDVLCNLEAMKMKSPIRSTAPGTVAQIAINEGQNVNFGDVLFVLQ